MKKFSLILLFSFFVTHCSEPEVSKLEELALESAKEDVYGTEGPHLQYDEYEVLFTNPLCKLYQYSPDQNAISNDGNPLFAKPLGAFCSASDAEVSGSHRFSPQNKLISWIQDPSTTEIFFTYLSFSNKPVAAALCEAIEKRNVKVEFVLDKQTNMARAKDVLTCQPQNGLEDYRPKIYERGHVSGINIAHNKIFIVNPRSEKIGIAFSSGNLSSGTVLHHENWHFIKTRSKTYFAQVHLCVMNAEINNFENAKEYMEGLNTCRKNIPYPEEVDIKTYFIPGDGDGSLQSKRASSVLTFATAEAKKIDAAAHRFSNKNFNKAIENALSEQRSVRLIVDDDVWWAGHGGSSGPNTGYEFRNVMNLKNFGLAVKFMETNHREFLLHHNKFAIFTMPNENFSSVFAGAGNFTNAAFKENWENYYYIRIPKVVKAFQNQYNYLWSIASTEGELPQKNIIPPLRPH